MMIGLLCTLLAMIAAPRFAFAQHQLITLNGTEVKGTFKSLESETIKFVTDGQLATFSSSEIERVVINTEVANQTSSRPIIQLLDSSVLSADGITLKSGQVSCTIDTIENQLSQLRIHNIRFQPKGLSEAIDTSWNALMSQELEQDLVVIRKTDEDSGSVELVPYEGVILSINESEVLFNFNDTEVPVERTRIEGVRFYQTGTDTSKRSAKCRLDDGHTTNLFASSLDVSENGIFRAMVAGDVELKIPASSIGTLDFAYDRVRYLDALQVASFEWRPFFPSRTSETLLNELSRYRINESFAGESLALMFPVDATEIDADRKTQQTFQHGFALRSSSRMMFELPPEFQRLVGFAGIDPAMQPQGNVVLTIRADGRTLIQEPITGTDNSPLKIDVDITGVERLTIDVAFGENLDIADQLNLCGMRLLK